MSAKVKYLIITFFMLFGAGICTEAYAQLSLGVIWDQAENIPDAERDLALFDRYGVKYIEVSYPVDEPLLKLLEQSSFTVLVRLQPRYLTLNDIQNNKQELYEHYIPALTELQPYLNVAAAGLLSNSQTMHPGFDEIFEPVLDSLSSFTEKSLYHYTSDGWYYFERSGNQFGFHYDDEAFQTSDLYAFNAHFEVAELSKAALFVQSNWLNEALNSYPELSESLLAYRDSNDWKLPLPEVDQERSFPNWLVLILLILWIGLAFQMKYLPYVRPMMIRYYLAHRFFVDDILHYRERAALGGILLMIQHAIFGGMVLYMASKTLISEAGLEALFYHFPLLAIAGSNYLSLFFFGIIGVFIIQSVALLWLYLPAKNIDHISQAINLYAGFFYIDFILATIMLTLYIAGFGATVILSLGILFLLVWYGAFNIAALNMASGMGTGRFTFLGLTIGLHTIISLGLLIVVMMNSAWIQILQLAVKL